ncbi:hypothetical protein BH23THE1_BH23THE1_15330 [soil metagenome]
MLNEWAAKPTDRELFLKLFEKMTKFMGTCPSYISSPFHRDVSRNHISLAVTYGNCRIFLRKHLLT